MSVIDDMRRAFVQGAKWWEWKKEGSTMWQSDQQEAWKEAKKRYTEDDKPQTKS